MEVKKYRLAALSENTKASYRVHRDCYLRFCAYFGYKAIPPAPVTIARFITFLARSLKPQSIRGYVSRHQGVACGIRVCFFIFR